MKWWKWTFCILALLFNRYLNVGVCRAQDLAPRAYIITPIHSNAITLTYSFYSGSIEFDGTVPITGATARVSVPVLSYFHSLNLFGRTATLTASLPYGVGEFRGSVVGADTLAYRSGLFPPTFRFSVNIRGGPAMNVEEYSKWQQTRILGVSFKVIPPLGQYDETRLINYGTNRWAFKPEFGYSQRWGHWILDAYGGAWLFTTNPEFFSHNQYVPGTTKQSESPIGSLEAHLSYDFRRRRRFWFSLDANFWSGGATSLNGVQNPSTVQRNSRVGTTASVPLTSHQSIKISYSNGAYVAYGGNYQNISAAWQYSWLGRPN